MTTEIELYIIRKCRRVACQAGWKEGAYEIARQAIFFYSVMEHFPPQPNAPYQRRSEKNSELATFKKYCPAIHRKWGCAYLFSSEPCCVLP